MCGERKASELVHERCVDFCVDFSVDLCVEKERLLSSACVAVLWLWRCGCGAVGQSAEEPGEGPGG